MPLEKPHRARVGVPWTTASEEARNDRRRFDNYLRAIRDAGGDPVEISLSLDGADLERVAASLDAVLLPGAAADVDPRRYGEAPHPASTVPDPRREHTDDALLDHALAAAKPLLAVCYGAQILNVHLGGTLLQDIPSELPGAIEHSRKDDHLDASHPARLTAGRLNELAGATEVCVNSSHHQAILAPGQGLRVVAVAPDGVVEAVEWTGGPGWIFGVQWHPERMSGDAFAEALFRRLVSEARIAAHGR
jgi:putative glutamine amidotransferase